MYRPPHYIGPPTKAVGYEGNMTALLGEAILFDTSTVQVMSAVPRSRQAVSTALYRDGALLRPACSETPTVPGTKQVV